MTPEDIQKLRFEILERAMTDIPFDGWTIDVFTKAATDIGHDPAIINAIFPQGIHDTLRCFSNYADDLMIQALHNENVEIIRIRDKIAHAVEKRIECLQPYKDCVRQSAGILAKPQYMRLAASITWNTADKIWNWAGDTATDYNRYTKRGLLGGVISSTMLYWLQDQSEHSQQTKSFLNRRIENVLFIGKTASPIIKPFASLVERFIVRGSA